MSDIIGRLEILYRDAIKNKMPRTEAVLEEAIAEIQSLQQQLDEANKERQDFEKALFKRAEIINEITADRDRLREALENIAANTCCNNCQEAALVAKQALSQLKE